MRWLTVCCHFSVKDKSNKIMSLSFSKMYVSQFWQCSSCSICSLTLCHRRAKFVLILLKRAMTKWGYFYTFPGTKAPQRTSDLVTVNIRLILTALSSPSFQNYGKTKIWDASRKGLKINSYLRYTHKYAAKIIQKIWFRYFISFKSALHVNKQNKKN